MTIKRASTPIAGANGDVLQILNLPAHGEFESAVVDDTTPGTFDVTDCGAIQFYVDGDCYVAAGTTVDSGDWFLPEGTFASYGTIGSDNVSFIAVTGTTVTVRVLKS